MGKDYRPLDKSDVALVQPIFNEHVLYVQNCTKCQGYKAESGTIFRVQSGRHIGKHPLDLEAFDKPESINSFDKY